VTGDRSGEIYMKKNNTRGMAYGVGVGPGDPELMTLKACRLIRENDVIAVPGKVPQDAVAYKIAVQAVPELAEKELVPVYMPMVKDRDAIRESHAKAADLLKSYLDSGRNVVYLTLGDSTIYCTFSYIQHILEADGYDVELVSGIPSFCAAAARLGVSLTEWNESLHVMPALHNAHEGALEWPGNYVLMKSARRIPEVKKMLEESGYDVIAAENCSMENEKLYRSVDEIPDDAGYFTLIIAKEKKESSI
jgi:precorrin-2/cobalt-factor-2 C20-methyltransferase